MLHRTILTALEVGRPRQATSGIVTGVAGCRRKVTRVAAFAAGAPHGPTHRLRDMTTDFVVTVRFWKRIRWPLDGCIAYAQCSSCHRPRGRASAARRPKQRPASRTGTKVAVTTTSTRSESPTAPACATPVPRGNRRPPARRRPPCQRRPLTVTVNNAARNAPRTVAHPLAGRIRWPVRRPRPPRRTVTPGNSGAAADTVATTKSPSRRTWHGVGRGKRAEPAGQRPSVPRGLPTRAASRAASTHPDLRIDSRQPGHAQHQNGDRGGHREGLPVKPKPASPAQTLVFRGAR